MKRFPKTLVAAMIIAATGAAIMVGCRKEESAQMKNSVAQTGQNMSPEEQKVLDFLADYDAMKQGMKAEGEPVCPEDARWYIETSMNYCHGFSHILTTNVRLDTVRVAMPKTDEQGLIEYENALETYDNIIDAVRETYKAIDMENKTLQFVMMSIEEGQNRDDSEEIVVIMNTGSETEYSGDVEDFPWYGVPFAADLCLRWGNLPYMTAANTACYWIQYWINFYDLTHQCYYIPCPTCYTYFLVDPHIVTSVYGNANDDNTFYVEGLTYNQALNYEICTDDLNKYYTYFMLHGHEEGVCTNIYGVDSYYNTEIIDYSKEISPNNWTILYIGYIYNATRVWRSDLIYPYPDPIDD